jgi:nitrate/TMAO reductase-like tetraheme cytochrome c subunit
MAKISLAGFKDPVRRPRYIIWTGVAVLVLAAVMIVALGATSTRWFCIEVCHKVQDDAIASYQRSTHANVSCMSCHMPVGANPVIFILHKAEALGELYMTVRNDYELPLNGASHVSLKMKATQCTQCHVMENRRITPSPGIIINHSVHAEVNADCPVCHNRIAHNESGDYEPKLKDPKTKQVAEKHDDFMSMTACFRCHDLEAGAAAPGRCAACHPKDFDLLPPSHKAADFYPKGHAEMAKAKWEESQKALAGEGEGGAEGEGAASKETSFLGVDKAYASGGEEAKPVAKAEVAALLDEERKLREEEGDKAASVGGKLPLTKSVFYCYTCHESKFCNDCHGMQMPHPAEFKEPKTPQDAAGHPAVSKTLGKKCVMCHGENSKTWFCDDCHHGKQAGGWKFVNDQPWTTQQHPKAVAAGGVKACTTKCHTAKFCVDCHTGRKVLPASHKGANWTKPAAPGALTVLGKQAAKASAGHSTAALQSVEQCDVCHGPGGVNAPFCKGCHKLEMPHAQAFKQNHLSAKKTPAVCLNCHLLKEVCSNCHHVGSSLTTPWIKVHGGATAKNGVASCIEKCHKKEICVSCHTSRKAIPASHKAKTFVRDATPTKAGHVQQYTAGGELCTYCHAGEVSALPNSAFCTGCHKLQMPHPSGFGPPQGQAPTASNGGVHAEQFKAGKMNRAVCANCHVVTFCNNCHHQGSSATKPWVRYHPVIVKKTGAEPCFACHKELFCSDCHVNRAAKIMGK